MYYTWEIWGCWGGNFITIMNLDDRDDTACADWNYDDKEDEL